LTRRGNREAFELYAKRLTQAAAIVRRVGRAIHGRMVEVAENECAIGLTGPADVLQPLIDVGVLERVHMEGELGRRRTPVRSVTADRRTRLR
jgi:hypothetical protein